MSFVTLLGISVGLAMDATAVAIATAILLGEVSRRQIFRFAFHFGLFQAAMPVIGWLAGRELRAYVETWADWIGFSLLLLVGGKAIIDALRSNEGEALASDPTRGLSLVILSIATSIDALAVGLSLGMLRVRIWYAAGVIGVVTAAMTVCGMLVGARVGQRFGLRIRILGGLVLIGIGIKILL